MSFINPYEPPRFLAINNSIKWGMECPQLNTQSSVDPAAVHVLYFDTHWHATKPTMLSAMHMSEMKGIGQFRIWLSDSAVIPKIQEAMQKRTSLDIKMLKYDNLRGNYDRVMTWRATKCVIIEYWFQSQISAEEPHEVHGVQIASNGEITYEMIQNEDGDPKGRISTSPWDVKRGSA